MRIAVLSDIHSNLQALDAVLADIEDRRVDAIWCLGDVVGYGANPNECCRIVQEKCDLCLAGNHDLVVRGDIEISAFSAGAAAAARWTAEVLDGTSRAFLTPLRPHMSLPDFGLYHASPRDPVWEYVLSLEQAYWCMRAQKHRVCLIGHSHVACHFTMNDDEVAGEPARDGSRIDIRENEWIINPGSVGQPRDGNPDSAYLVLDGEEETVTFHRVKYPIDKAAAAIEAAGLPAQLSQRLFYGQ